MSDSIVYQTSSFCEAHQVKHAVFSPGSRNAPLTISFARNPRIKKWIIPDERAAGFIALGIAQKLKQPVVLCCTSGSAVLNYYPAIAEAFYRELPLIVLSADRPPELIDQRDGQTIRQFEVLDHHVKGSFQLPVVTNAEEAKDYERQLKEALHLSLQLPLGPVHVNIPFREPFYPASDEKIEVSHKSFATIVKAETPTIENKDLEHINELKTTLCDSNLKCLLLIGQQEPNEALDHLLKDLEHRVPIINSPLANLKMEGIKHVDFFLTNDTTALHPDILITSGLSVLSKKLKNFIRSLPLKAHYHFDPSGVAVDTFQSNPTLVKSELAFALNTLDFSQVDLTYKEKWQTLSKKTKEAIEEYQGAFCEATAAKTILHQLPAHADLHLANSMSVRWADLFGLKDTDRSVFSNRGTSGIDGCTSTVVGSGLVSDNQQVLLTGDVAFLYDKNAFFHNYSLPNIRIIILNNQGGGIFRLIDGPSHLPELENYFETRHNRTAKYICMENGLAYLTASNLDELEKQLPTFYQPSDRGKILEVYTSPEVNQIEFKKLKSYINERINSMD